MASTTVTSPGQPQRAIPRLAALLVSISRNNAYEGRNPNHVPDNLTSGFIADLLGVSIPELSEVLVEFQQRGVIRTQDHGLWLQDVADLEALTCRQWQSA